MVQGPRTVGPQCTPLWRKGQDLRVPNTWCGFALEVSSSTASKVSPTAKVSSASPKIPASPEASAISTAQVPSRAPAERTTVTVVAPPMRACLFPSRRADQPAGCGAQTTGSPGIHTALRRAIVVPLVIGVDRLLVRTGGGSHTTKAAPAQQTKAAD